MSLDNQKTWPHAEGKGEARRDGAPPPRAARRKRLPPLKALKAFESAARLGSFARAAQELFVTQTAVSHQIKLLEEHLGGLLFERLPSGLALTPQGQAIYPSIAAGFEHFEAAMTLLPRPAKVAAQVLVVSALPSFSQEWLIPRLVDFRARWPDIDVLIETDYKMADLAGGTADVAIRFGRGGFGEDLRADLLSTETVTPVCSPSLLKRQPGDYEPSEVAHDFVLLNSSVRMVHEPWMSWDLWLEEVGVEPMDAATGPRFSDPLLILRTAIAGRGMALGRSMLVRDHLQSGRLVAPFPDWVKPILSSYYVVSTVEKSRLERVTVFREWLLEIAAREAAGGFNARGVVEAEPAES
ncbi:LysR substrate-binding domain-containing protein [Variovorax sp. VNK109]|uniref:LysR substrate-binding domain-containing protein n=1 Tax=Variovorax sp. VNK109 TaxID=3400919 RepID=UPI003C126A8A